MLQEELLKALKTALKSKGINYSMLAKHLDISEGSVKRSFAQGTISIERLSLILQKAEITFMDLAKIMECRSEGDYVAPSFDLQTKKLNISSQIILKRKIQILIEEINSMTAHDHAAFSIATTPVSFFMSTKPFQFYFGMQEPGV